MIVKMLSYIDIGPVPCDEVCEQVGPNYNRDLARHECVQFIEVIRKKLGPEPFGAALAIKEFPHDFGPYLSVICSYSTPESEAYAFACEGNTPMTWDDVTPFNWRNHYKYKETNE